MPNLENAPMEEKITASSDHMELANDFKKLAELELQAQHPIKSEQLYKSAQMIAKKGGNMHPDNLAEARAGVAAAFEDLERGQEAA